MRIFLSPSDQWSNTVATKEHSEAYHCIKIAEYAKTYLELNGYDVLIGDTSKEKTYSKRVKKSNDYKADLHICIHTNAGGGEGTTVFCFKGKKGNKYVKSIYNEVALLTPTKDRGIKEVSNLYEINHTKATCVYVECEFHDTKKLEQWIDMNLIKLGMAIAKGVCEADNKNFNSGNHQNKGTIYRVQVGAFTSKENAEKLVNELKSKGYSAYYKKEDR